MISKFEATGCSDDRPRSGRPSTRRNAAEMVNDEMETVEGSSMHGEVSARAVARRTGIPYTTVWLALRSTLRCYPYKIHRHHELLPGDSVNRRAFAAWAFQKMADDNDWLSNLLGTDEAHFTLRGSVNTHNCRIWATENPRTVVETPFHDEKVTVWVGFTTSTVTGPFFEEMRDSGSVTATVTGERYADMLQNRIMPSLADKHLLERTIFMQDGAPKKISCAGRLCPWQRFQDDGNVSRCYSTCRPGVTTPNEDRYLAVTDKRNRRSTTSDLSCQLSLAANTTVSRQSVYRRLGHIGLYACRPVRCIPHTATHCHLRLTWSRVHELWSPQTVVLCDVSRRVQV
ncbi:RNA-directed DNA polymerase from mobile element jockey [Trichonephila clavipes]|nr:RNA-directed DNA polymerase from mobile element jockey [Trichonephila clavipes]